MVIIHMMKKNVHKLQKEKCITRAQPGDLIKLKTSGKEPVFGIIIKAENGWHSITYEVNDPFIYHCLVKGEKLELIKESFEVIGD